MLSRWLAFVVWALLGATVVTWLLQMAALPSPVPAHAIPVDATASFRTELTRLFGAPPVPVASEGAPVRGDDRLKLIGLVASTSTTSAGSSLALIAMDGKPPRSYRVGAVIDGERRVLAVRKGAVDIGPEGGPVAFTLNLPGLPPPATGVPPSAAAAGAAQAQSPVPAPAPGMPPAMPAPIPQQEVPQQQPHAPIEPQPAGAPQVPPPQPGG